MDSDLLDRAGRGDDIAVAALYRELEPSLLAYAFAQRAPDPGEVVNLAFFDGIRSLPNLRSRTMPVFRSYVFRAIRSRIAGERRRSHLDTVPLGDDLLSLAESDLSIDDRVVSDRAFAGLVEHLTPPQRAVMTHRYFYGYSVAETAQRLQRSPEAVRQLQARGLAHLRNLGLALILVFGLIVFLLAQRTMTVESGPISEPESLPVSELVVVSTVGSELCLDGSDMLVGGVAPLARCSDSPGQVFSRDFVEGGAFRLVSTLSGMCLNDGSGGPAVLLYECEGSPNEIWEWDGERLRSLANSLMCLTASAQGEEATAMRPCNDNDLTQRFTTSAAPTVNGAGDDSVPVVESPFPGALSPVGSNLCIDAGNSTDSGSDVVMAVCDNSPGQTFDQLWVYGGFQLAVRGTGTCLNDGSGANAAVYHVCQETPQDTWTWDGSRLRSVANTTVCLSGSNTVGTRVLMTPCSDESGQQFRSPVS